MKVVKLLTFITIISLPLYLVRCKSFSWCVSPIPFTLLEILILASFASWVVWVSFLIRSKKESIGNIISRQNTPILVPALIFIFLAALSLLFTPDLKGGLGIWKAYFLEGFLLYLVVVDLSVRVKDFLWVVRALIISAILVASYSLASFLYFAYDLGLSNALDLRIMGIYEFANAIPLYLGPIAALIISAFFIKQKETFSKLYFYISILGLVFILASIILSQSKGGIVGIFSILIVWLGYLVYKTSPKKYFKYVLSSLAVVYLIISLLVFLNIDNLVPKTKKYVKNSVTNRYCIWQGSRDLLEDKVVTGSGLNGFHLDYEKYKTCLKNDYQYPHNILLTFWAELGLAGLIAFLYLSYKMLWLGGKGSNEVLSVGLIASLVYIFIHGFVDVPFFKNDLSAQFWLIAAMIAINSKVQNSSIRK